LKVNGKHKGKEFQSYFHFVGQVKQHIKGYGDNAETKEFYEQTTTRTNKPRRVVQFDLLTTKYNKLKIELSGMEREKAYAYSSKHKRTITLDWKDRNDKNKLPDNTYHVMTVDWDLSQDIGSMLKEGMWVEVKGKYQFDKFYNDEGKEFLIAKRIITSLIPVTDGQDIKINSKDTVQYVCDFADPNFKEVNTFNLEVGIKSVYQDEETRDVKVNGVFLDYGKERSTPRDLELMVYYKEPAEGKRSLADGFMSLNRFDVVEVRGIDNNRPEFAMVTEQAMDDDPFADVDETEASSRMAISGTKKGLEVVTTVGSVKRNALTEEEITPVVDVFYGDPFNSNINSNDDDDVPF
jgi:hypothetical protein